MSELSGHSTPAHTAEPSAAERLDRRLVALGLAPSRARAAELVAAGLVRIDGRVAEKPAQRVAPGTAVALAGEGLAWVSRGAIKLLHALDHFDLAPRGLALDLGASTGGFTEVLLARGVAEVIALDVGHGQLHPRLATDPRVRLIEGENSRAIPAALVPAVDWMTADLSFVSLLKALPGPLNLARPGGILVALVKPQFEVGRAGVGRGGIVRDPARRAAACDAVAAMLGEQGWDVLGLTESPIEGGDGNIEFLLAARRSSRHAPAGPRRSRSSPPAPRVTGSRPMAASCP
ncbi:MAG: TlyA family RNA methyltransferase [Pseudomonadota bacterium]